MQSYIELREALQASTLKPSRVEQALALRNAGLSPLPLIPMEKNPTLKCHPALSIIRLSEEIIRKEFSEANEIGIVGGFNGVYSVDIDADENDPEEKTRQEAQRQKALVSKYLGEPIVRIKGNRGFKDLRRMAGWIEPPDELKHAAAGYFLRGYQLTRIERIAWRKGWRKKKHEPTDDMRQAIFDIKQLNSIYDDLLNRFIAENGLIPTSNKPIEIKSFRTISVMPPSRHAKAKEGYRYV